ncbi:MAG: sensor histidine kinase [Huintestinicola sp.]
MRKSIASEYKNLCLALVTAALIIMASFIAAYSIMVYRKDRMEYLEAASAYAKVQTAILMGSGDMETLQTVYEDTSKAVPLIVLINCNGDVLACSEASPCLRNGIRVEKEILKGASEDGSFYIGTFGGMLESSYSLIEYRIDVNGTEYFLMAGVPADGMIAYIRNIILLCAVIFLVVISIIRPLVKHAVNRILNPLMEMTLAAKRFGEGDFSDKVEIKDRSELGFLANTLNEMAGSLEAIEENRKSFISNVSHELKTPMTTIGGFVDGILDGTIPKEQHRHYLKIVSEEVDRLARLVRSMLNVSKYEAGELKLQTEDFDITDLTIKTLLLFEKKIESKNIDIRGLDSDRHFVNADKDLIQQVIYNLTENAVKFVDEGGYISYSFGMEENMVSLTIRNSGEGLKKNEINKVFDRFYKTDESRGKDKTGVGLGLSIVKSIIKLHEGSIMVRSKTGEYTEFEFRIPAGNAPSRRSE